MSTKDIAALIDGLADDLKPAKPLMHPFWRVLLVFGGVMAYVSFSVVLIGVRGNWAEQLHQPQFVFETVMALALSFSAAIASAWLSVPDMRGQNWVLTVPLSILTVFCFWNVLYGVLSPHDINPILWSHCTTDGIILGFIPTVLAVGMARGGATTRPYMMALMNVLVVAGIGYLGLRFTCPVDTFGHAFVHHLMPFVALGALFGFLARYLYRW